MAFNFNWLGNKKIEDIYKQPVNGPKPFVFNPPPRPVAPAPVAPAPVAVPRPMPRPIPQPVVFLPTNPNQAIANVARFAPSAVVPRPAPAPQLRQFKPTDLFNPNAFIGAVNSGLGNFVKGNRTGPVENLRDIFDANSPEDVRKRQEAGQSADYRTQQLDLYRTSQGTQGSKRPYQNFGGAAAGNTARFVNTLGAAAVEGRDTANIGILQALGLNKEANIMMDQNTKFKQQMYQPNSGIFGQGTIFDNPDEYGKLGAGELTKRIGLTTLGAGFEILPFAKGAGLAGTAAYQALNRPGQIVARSLAGAAENVIQDAAEQQFTYDKYRPEQGAFAGVSGIVMPNVGPALSAIKNKATQGAANKALSSMDNQIKLQKLSTLDTTPNKQSIITPPRAIDPLESLKQEARKYKSAEEFVKAKNPKIDFSLTEGKGFGYNAGYITVNHIVVPKDMRRQGAGKKAMQDLIVYADASGKQLQLTPDTKFGSSRSGLDRFYKDLGFVANKGKNKDWSHRNLMHRNPTTDIYNQAQPPIVGNGLQPIGDALSGYKAGANQVSRATEISNKYGGKLEDVQRNIDKFGENATNNMYANKHDALKFDPTTGKGIESLDAVVTSELNKTTKPIVKMAVPEKPVVKIIDNQTGVPGSTVIDKNTGEIIQAVDAKPNRVGTMVQNFFEKRRGNVAIKFTDIEGLAKGAQSEIDLGFKNINSNFASVARRVDESLSSGKSIDDVLTPAEASLWRNVEAELDYIRKRQSTGRRNIGAGDFGEQYVPHQTKDAYDTRASLFESFRQNKPGNEFKRMNSIDTGKLDYSSKIIHDYITRYADTQLTKEERVMRAIARDNPNATRETVVEAASSYNALVDKVDNLETRVTLGGAGKRKTVVGGVGNTELDFPAEMAAIGKTLGKEQVTITGKPRGLTNGEKINSIDVIFNGEVHPAGDFFGLTQMRDAPTFAGAQVASAKTRSELVSAVEDRLNTVYRLHPDEVAYAVKQVNNIKTDLPPQFVADRVESIYRNASKTQMLNALQISNIEDPLLRREISRLAVQTVRAGSIELAASAKTVKVITRTQNAIFRKANVGSALNEMSDMVGFFHAYGINLKAGVPDFRLIKELRLGDIDPAIEPYIRALESGVSKKNVLQKINSAANLYKFVEAYKAAVIAKTAKEFYSNPKNGGLVGDALTARILKDYRDLTLPVDAFTKTALDNIPLWTQYMSWGTRNVQKEWRFLMGHVDAGVLNKMSQGERTARYIYLNLPVKTAFWLSSNALKGTAILTAFGLTDYTGLSNQDYSGIQEEDKSLYDKTTQFTNASTTGSLINSVVQTIEKENLKNSDKYKNAGYNPYKNNNAVANTANIFNPQVVKNVYGAGNMQIKGYSENAGGKIQYEAPTDAYNQAKAYLFGKGQTQKGREYSGSTGIVERTLSGKNPLTSIADMAKEQVNVQDRNYINPLSDKYTEKYKAAATTDRTAILQGAREGAKKYKEFNNTPQGAAWKELNSATRNPQTNKMETDIISPEKWKGVLSDKSGKTYDQLKQAAVQRNKDFGDALDPIYSDKWSKYSNEIITMRSQYTGDDTEMKNIANATKPWYKGFMADSIDYINKIKGKEYTDSAGYGTSQRSKDYYQLTVDNPSIPDNTKATYPLISQYYDIKNKNPDLAKQFFKNNADVLSKNFDQQKIDKWNWTNKMRALEGAPPIEWQTFQNVTFGYEDDERKVAQELYWKQKEGSGGGTSPYKYMLSGGRAKKVSLIKNQSKTTPLRIKKMSLTNPKVTMKKSRV